MQHNTFDIYYDTEADFLELTIGLPPENETSEQTEDEVILSKDADTGRIYGIGILSFGKRQEILKKLLQNLNIDFPLKIGI